MSLPEDSNELEPIPLDESTPGHPTVEEVADLSNRGLTPSPGPDDQPPRDSELSYLYGEDFAKDTDDAGVLDRLSLTKPD